VDKALVELDGRLLVERVVAAMDEAGAREMVVVGGDGEAFARLGLRSVPDRWPGEGPLGGVVTGLAALAPDVEIVVVAACDLVGLTARLVWRLVAALASAREQVSGAVAVADGVAQWHLVALRHATIDHLASQFGAGERSLRRGMSGLVLVEVAVDPDAICDVDSPRDLYRYASGPRASNVERGDL
jgi:molybdopterin-guanine dinucleotide biosynthesis protein A